MSGTFLQPLLNRLRRRDDRGSAMVVVLGVMMVGAVITTTLAFSVMYNTERTMTNRAEIKALEAADAAIDTVLQQYEGKKYNELDGVCAQSMVFNNYTVNVTFQYTVLRGGTSMVVACPQDATGDIVASVAVTATATSPVQPLGGEAIDRTVQAIFAPTPPEVVLDKAIFSEGSLTITNNTSIAPSGGVDPVTGLPLNDANVYANSSIDCMTQTLTSGKIYAAQGYLKLQNNCRVKNTIWARDYVAMDSAPVVEGDVYSASSLTGTSSGDAAVRMYNGNGYIAGNVVTNGSFYSEAKDQANSGVGGSVFTRTGGIRLYNGSVIRGGAYAGGTITLENTSRIGGNAWNTKTGVGITGSGTNNKIQGTQVRSGSTVNNVSTPSATPVTNVATNPPTVLSASIPSAVGYPTLISPPQREPMPYITMNATDIQKWVNAGWSHDVVSDPAACNGAGAWNFINNLSAGNHILDYRATCNGVDFDGANSASKTLTLKGNVVILSDDRVNFTNNPKIVSNDTSPATGLRSLYVIIPADIVTWVPAGGGQMAPPVCGTGYWPPPNGNITYNTAVYFKNVNLMSYAPCKVTYANDMATGSDPYTGQVYGGQVTLGTSMQMKMAILPIPSLATVTPDPNSLAKMTMSSRYDVRG